ncbi:hypothetical protein OCA16_26100 [Bacillus cereus]|nr:hypothetical protein [Bacillus cereus]
MRVYVYRESYHGEKTKNPPTTFCQITEEKVYREETYYDGSKDRIHRSSEWFCEVDNVGEFLTGLQYHENEPITFRHNTDVDYYIVYIGDEE